MFIRFYTNQPIIINAVTTDANCVETKTTAGKIMVLANDATKRKKAKILLIEVKTPEIIRLTGSKTGSSTGQQALFEKYLRQALIETDVVTETVDVSGDSNFASKYVQGRQIAAYYGSTQPAGFVVIQDYLYSKLQSQLKAINPNDENKYDNYFKAFYLGENGGKVANGIVEGLNGYSSGKNVVLFPTKNDQTAAHEFLHSFNLPHSFANKEADTDALYTFEYAETENLMDYSHRRSPAQTRYSLWKWQWIKANASII